MSQFNWQQDAEDQWDDPVIYTPEPENPRPRRRWWPIPIVLLLVAGAGWLVMQQANRRVEEATTAVTDDLLSSHSLLLQAAYNHDVDLFITLLSGRDDKWTASQQALLPADLFFNRPSFGLTAIFPPQPDFNTAQNNLVSLNFAPDLLSAELVVSQPYTFTLPDGQLQTTSLWQTAVYRLGNQRWLYAPPEDEFWGDTLNYERNRLITIYPERDEEIAQRLAIDLALTLNRLCTIVTDINCPADLIVTLVLSPDPGTFVNLANPQTLWQSGLRVVLPTPTLVGIPVDEAGYEALRQGYAVQLATAVIPQLVEYECCVGAPFFQALLDYQLSQLGLRTWPITQADYRRVYEEETSLNRAISYWRADNLQAVNPEDQWLIYLVADFLIHGDRQSSPAFAQRTLNEWSGLIPWLSNNVILQPETTISSSAILGKWVKTASILSQVSTDPAPLPLPNQDLLLLCTINGFDGPEEARLYRYHLATDAWVEERRTDELAIMSPLPDDTAVILQGFNDTPIGLSLWQDGQLVQSIINQEKPVLSFGHLHPSGQILAYQLATNDEGITPHLIDLTSCEGNQCASEARPGLLAWSPDGRQSIIANPYYALIFNYLPVNGRHFFLNERLDQEPYTLFRTDGDQQIAIGTGFEPFWVDNETYGYLRPSGDNLEIVIAKTADDIPQLLISSNTLLSLLPEDSNLTFFHMNYVLTTQLHQPNKLFIIATSDRNVSPYRAYYFFTYDLISKSIALRLHDYLSVHNLDFSPDGRYLITSNWQEPFASEPLSLNYTLLYDLSQNQSKSFATVNPSIFPAYLHDWSADGQWLAILADDNKIALTIPGTDHYQLIRHTNGPCAALAWINPIE